jgi:3-phosphoshikimate 1-carboxyvinyltransferase
MMRDSLLFWSSMAHLKDFIEIQPVAGPVRGSIRPPGSKSITNRAFILAALAKGKTTLTGVLDSQDTQVMAESLRRLGVNVAQDLAAKTAVIEGLGGGPKVSSAELFLENSGTSIRFLTALCTLGQGRFRLDGNARMRERPIGPLVDALAACGAKIDCELAAGCPPLVIEAKGWSAKRVTVSSNLSSQYLSALLMAAPACGHDVEVAVEGPLVSRPYIDMTLEMMRQFGAKVDEPLPNQFRIASTGYAGREYAIEPDASAASYFFGVAAVTGGTVTVEGLTRDALQGDVRFVEALVQMGCQAEWHENSITVTGKPLHGVDVDMNAISDTAQTLACVAVFADGPTRIRNVAHMRLKETDRVTAVVNELRRLGLRADEHPDGITIHPGPVRPATVATYDDHRMAMSFSLIGLRSPGIRIADPGCTAKTYPEYFQDLERLCGSARRASS